jgi:putative oxidoreductase
LRYLDRMQPLGLLALRLTMGSIMVGHGWHKVNGHLHDFAGYVAGMAVPGWLGYVAAFVEFFGGILIVAGLLTRCVAFAFLIDMSVAIIKVHWPHGFMGSGGYEFPLLLWTVALALIFFGAGAISIDAIRGGGGGGWRDSKSR